MDDPMDVDDRINGSREASSSGREALHSENSFRPSINGHSSAADGVRGAQRSQPADANALPMLASACPGWVCYAEKTHGDYVLPHISSTKSPQVGPFTSHISPEFVPSTATMMWHSMIILHPRSYHAFVSHFSVSQSCLGHIIPRKRLTVAVPLQSTSFGRTGVQKYPWCVSSTWSDSHVKVIDCASNRQ